MLLETDVRSSARVEAPGYTPATVVLSDARTLWLFAGIALMLAGLAAYDHGALLLHWDEPIQRWVQDQRTNDWDGFFRVASRLGSNVVIFSAAAGLAAFTWRRCRFLALAILAAAALRPGMEFVVKAVIDRPRPDIDQLVPGTGASHPSGHVLASIALYGLVPAVVAVHTGSRRWWRASAVAVMAIVPLIAASRVYLGVHWFFDVLGGLVIGTLYLYGVERVFRHLHPETACAHD